MNYRLFGLLVFIFFLLSQLSFSQNLEGIKSGGKVKLSGNLGASMVFYHVDGRETNRPNFSWMLIGNPVLSIYGITMPFSMTVSEQQRSFQQPFNKIGVSPYYKWAKLHLGYRNLSFSQYTLGGHTILGAGAEINPGKFRFGFMHGRLLRPVDTNPLLILEPGRYKSPVYKRNGTGFKLGYGTSDNYFDVAYFHGWDILNSIKDQNQEMVKPAENAVFSLTTKQKLSDKYEVGFEFAKSVYTGDIRSDSVDNKLSGFSNLIKSNATTLESNVFDTYLGYNSQDFGLKLRVKQIDPGFRSMGTYYIQNDYRNVTIEPRYSFSENKYSLSGSLGWQKDNLKKTLQYGTNRKIGSLGFSAAPVKWYRADINLSNYNINMRKGLTELDTLMTISQTTRSFNLNQNLIFTGESLAHIIFISYNNQLLKDKNKNTAALSDYTSNMWSGSYLLSVIPKQMNFTVTYNYTSFDLASMKTRVSGPVLTYSSSMLKNSLNLSVSNAFYKNFLDGEENSKLNIFSVSSSYRISRKQRLRLSIYFHKSEGLMGNTSSSFAENKGEIGYSYMF